MMIRLLSPKLTSQNTNIQSESLKYNNAYVKEQLDLILIFFFLIQEALCHRELECISLLVFLPKFYQTRMKTEMWLDVF